MAQLPRYQRLGVKARQPGNIDFADTREQARYSDNLSQQLNRMSQFAFKEAARSATIRGQKRVQEEGAVETLEAIDEKGGAFTIADRAAYELGSRVAVAEIENAAELEIAQILSDAERNETPFSRVQEQLSDVNLGYSESLRVIDPSAAAVLKTNLEGASSVAIEKYSNWYVKLQAQKRQIRIAETGDLQFKNVLEYAVLPGTDLAKLEAYIQTRASLYSDTGASVKQTAKWIQKATDAAIKENTVYRFMSSDIEAQTQMLKDMETNPVEGMSLLETQGLRKSLQSDLNQKLSARRSASKGVVADIAIQTKLLTDGGMPSSTSITNLETQIEALGPDAGDARVALADLKFNIANAEVFRGQSFEELSQTVAQFRNGIVNIGQPGLDTPIEVSTLKSAETYLAAAEKALEDQDALEKETYQPVVNNIINLGADLQAAIDSGRTVTTERLIEARDLYNSLPTEFQNEVEPVLEEVFRTNDLLRRLSTLDEAGVRSWLEDFEKIGFVPGSLQDPNRFGDAGVDTKIEVKAVKMAEDIISSLQAAAASAEVDRQAEFEPIIDEAGKILTTLQSFTDKNVDVPDAVVKDLIETITKIPEDLRGDLSERLNTLGYTQDLLTFASETNVEGMRKYIEDLKVSGIVIKGETIGPNSPMELKALTLAEQLLKTMESAQANLLAADEKAKKEKFDPIVSDLKGRISDFNKIVQSGQPVSQEDFDYLVSVFNQLPNDFRGDILDELQGLGYLSDIVENSRNMNASQMARYIDNLGKGFDESRPGGLETYSDPNATVNTIVEKNRLDLAEKMLSQMKTGLAQDALSYGINAGTLDQNGYPLKLNQIDLLGSQEDLVASLQQRTKVAKAVSDKYLIPTQFFTAAERTLFAEYMRTADTNQKMSVFAAIVDVGEVNAQSMLAELSQTSPIDAGIGALVLNKRGDSAKNALIGFEIMNDPSIDIEGMDEAKLTEAYGRSALINLKGLRDVIFPVAQAIYASKAVGKKSFDSNLWTDSVSEAVGGSGDFGGIQSVRKSDTLLPPDYSADRVENALDLANPAAFAASSNMVLAEGMAEMIARNPGFHSFSLQRVPGEDMYRIISRKSGRPVVTDDNIKFQFNLKQFVEYVEANN